MYEEYTLCTYKKRFYAKLKITQYDKYEIIYS